MSEDPRDALLDVARDIVARRGYVGLTMHTASAAAGMTEDVARRYYRNRESLFAAAMRLPADPVSAIPALVAPGIEGMGERLVRFTLDTLRDPEVRDDMMSLARTGASAGHAVTGLQDFIEIGVVDRVAGMIGVPDARMRSALITSYLVGVATMRYGVRLEPLSSASDEEVIRMVAPVIQDLLDPRRPIPGSPLVPGPRPRPPLRTRPSSPEAPRGHSIPILLPPAPSRPPARPGSRTRRERANADRKSAAAGTTDEAGSPTAAKRASAGKPDAAKKSSAVKPRPARKSPASTRSTSAGTSRPAGTHTTARKATRGTRKPAASKRATTAEPRTTTADGKSSQRSATTAKGSTSSGARTAARHEGGCEGRGRLRVAQRRANSRAMAEVVAWSTRPSCQAMVTASTALST